MIILGKYLTGILQFKGKVIHIIVIEDPLMMSFMNNKQLILPADKKKRRKATACSISVWVKTPFFIKELCFSYVNIVKKT